MRINGLLLGTVIACLMMGASASANPGDAREIIVDFCETVAEEAGDTIEKLGNAAGDLAECPGEFADCRDGGLFGNDPLVEWDAYEDALRQARRENVEDRVQDFFNDPSPERSACLSPAIAVGKVCSAEAEE